MRLEGFLFGDEGAVARRLDEVSTSDWRPSFGAGLRLVRPRRGGGPRLLGDGGGRLPRHDRRRRVVLRWSVPAICDVWRIFPCAGSPADGAARGRPGGLPDTVGRLTVVGGKSAGISPGFTVRDRRGRGFLLELDPEGPPRLASGAGVIAARLV